MNPEFQNLEYDPPRLPAKEVRTDTYTWGLGPDWHVRMTDLVTGRTVSSRGRGLKALRDAEAALIAQLERERHA